MEHLKFGLTALDMIDELNCTHIQWLRANALPNVQDGHSGLRGIQEIKMGINGLRLSVSDARGGRMKKNRLYGGIRSAAQIQRPGAIVWPSAKAN
jgi:hypothetical protein